jgi:hypothetical protein
LQRTLRAVGLTELSRYIEHVGVSRVLGSSPGPRLVQRDSVLKAFVNQWLHIETGDGTFKRINDTWFQ